MSANLVFKIIRFSIFVLIFSAPTVSLGQRVLIPFQFAEINNKWGYIDSATGNMAIFPVFNSAGKFSKGYAPVVFKRRYSFLDTAGKPLFPFIFRDLPLQVSDTMYLNESKKRYLVKKEGEYFEYKNGHKYLNYPVSEYVGYNPEIVVYSGREMTEIMEKKRLEKSANLLKPKERAANSEFVIKLGLGSKTRNLGLNFRTYLHSNEKLTGMMLGGGFSSIVINRTNEEYKLNQYTLGLDYRVKLAPSFYAEFGLHPAVNRVVLNRQGSGAWVRQSSSYSEISASASMGFGFAIDENTRIGFDYKQTPMGLSFVSASNTFNIVLAIGI